MCGQSGPSGLDFDFKPTMKEVQRFELPANLALPKVRQSRVVLEGAR